MSDDGHHPLFVDLRGHPRLIQHGGLPVGDEPPVLHGPRREVRDGYHVCNRKVKELLSRHDQGFYYVTQTTSSLARLTRKLLTNHAFLERDVTK